MGGLHGVFVLGTLLVLTLGHVEAMQAKRQFCQSGWTISNNGCYAVINNTQNWMEAQMTCQVLNAHLVIITSQAENQAVVSMINSTGGERAWLGLNNLLVKDRYQWVNSDTDATYTNWRPGEPSHTYLGQVENCIEMWKLNGTWGWNDINCARTLNYFVCERE